MAKARDAGEADTSTIVKDMLSELFGFDKYNEITSEYLIKGTYCDLAVKLEGKLRILIEVKAIGLELKDAHTKQAADYAANQGVEWVILTNGAIWRIYRILFAQPISQDLVYESDILSTNHKNRSLVENLFLFAKEGQFKTVLEEFHERGQAKSRYVLGAMLLNDCVIDIMRRELRRLPKRTSWLHVPPRLRKTLANTNVIESAFSIVERVCANVKRWHAGDQRERWVGSGLLVAEKQFRRVQGHKQIPILLRELEALVPSKSEVVKRRKAS